MTRSAVQRTGAIRRIAPTDARDVKAFARLDRRLNLGRPRHVPDTRADLVKRLSGHSALHADVEHAVFVASAADGRDGARCAALINKRYQQVHRENVGFIGYLAAQDDERGCAREVVEAAEDWLAGRGVNRVVAGYNGHLLAGLGIRTADFDSEPVFPLPWHPPLYAEVLSSAGYRRTYPWWSYRIDLSSDAYREASNMALRDARCVVRPIEKKRWTGDLQIVMRLFNETFKNEWEYHPFTIEEMKEFFDPLKPILDPNLLLIAEVDGEPAGFCFGLPNWTAQMRKLDGKSSPVAQLRFAIGARRCTDAGLYAVGVAERHRGKHIGQTLASTLYRRFESRGLKGAEYHIVNDANTASKTLATSLGGRGRILYHNFDKQLR